MSDIATDPDVLLVLAMAGGDRAALGRLYDRHAPALLGLAGRMLGSPGDAEDLVHDVLLEAWRCAEAYDPRRASVRTWLAMRTRSRALDRLRAAGRVRPVGSPFSDSDEGRPEPAAETPEDPTLSPDRHRVRRALDALPAPQRAVLELGYYEGLSSAEIAERVSVPIGTVKSRVAAALARLREVMRADEGVGR